MKLLGAHRKKKNSKKEVKLKGKYTLNQQTFGSSFKMGNSSSIWEQYVELLQDLLQGTEVKVKRVNMMLYFL